MAGGQHKPAEPTISRLQFKAEIQNACLQFPELTLQNPRPRPPKKSATAGPRFSLGGTVDRGRERTWLIGKCCKILGRNASKAGAMLKTYSVVRDRPDL